MDDSVSATHSACSTKLVAAVQTHAILLASTFMVVVAAAYGMVPHA